MPRCRRRRLALPGLLGAVHLDDGGQARLVAPVSTAGPHSLRLFILAHDVLRSSLDLPVFCVPRPANRSHLVPPQQRGKMGLGHMWAALPPGDFQKHLIYMWTGHWNRRIAAR